MLIDWFTVGAQALNFVILVWLLKHFLYQPILDAIDAREQRIAAELADAEAKQAAAQKERDEFQHKNEEFDRQRVALLHKATSDAQAERQRLLDAARQAAEALHVKRQETLRNDARSLNKAISRRTQQEVFAIARKTLTDLAGTSLEERMSAVFMQRLRAVSGEVKESLAKALQAAERPAIVRSAFDLPAAQQGAIRNAVNETFSADVPLRFETAPDLVSGVELATDGHKVSWSITEYLASLETGVDELLRAKNKVATQAQPAATTTAARKNAAAETAPAPETKEK
jgi:F-type H+-transporting ATPase subunit b